MKVDITPQAVEHGIGIKVEVTEKVYSELIQVSDGSRVTMNLSERDRLHDLLTALRGASKRYAANNQVQDLMDFQLRAVPRSSNATAGVMVPLRCTLQRSRDSVGAVVHYPDESI